MLEESTGEISSPFPRGLDLGLCGGAQTRSEHSCDWLIFAAALI